MIYFHYSINTTINHFKKTSRALKDNQTPLTKYHYQYILSILHTYWWYILMMGIFFRKSTEKKILGIWIAQNLINFFTRFRMGMTCLTIIVTKSNLQPAVDKMTHRRISRIKQRKYLFLDKTAQVTTQARYNAI